MPSLYLASVHHHHHHHHHHHYHHHHLQQQHLQHLAQTSPGFCATECGGKPADVVFVLDRSNSVYIVDFEAQLKVLQDMVRIMDIGPDRTQVKAGRWCPQYNTQLRTGMAQWLEHRTRD